MGITKQISKEIHETSYSDMLQCVELFTKETLIIHLNLSVAKLNWATTKAGWKLGYFG